MGSFAWCWVEWYCVGFGCVVLSYVGLCCVVLCSFVLCLLVFSFGVSNRVDPGTVGSCLVLLRAAHTCFDFELPVHVPCD